ncbi:MAG TPA: amidohydrolase [Thermoanaerobaculia bacterium]|nr:amidohydrolase [Thermoanaerobaculia bacterium]
MLVTRSRTGAVTVAIATGVAALLCGCREAPRDPADLVLRGGAVYTLDPAREWAEAVAVDDGRIVFVGGDEEVEAFVGSATRVIELEGGMVLPGFHDVHVHPASGGLEALRCDLNGSASLDELRERVRAFAAANPDREWITGGGFDLPLFQGGAPRRELLDELVPDRPAYLSSSDGHSAWVNTRALEIAGVTAATADPPAGRIERDRATGEPSGTLREGAMSLVAQHLPPTSDEEWVAGLERGLEMANRFGITSLIEASADEEIARAYQTLSDRGALAARVVLSLSFAAAFGENGDTAAAVAELAAQRDRFGGPRLRADAVKLFADGVIEAGTAALLQPYVPLPAEAGVAGRPASAPHRGLPEYSPEDLSRHVTALDAAGFQVHIHAIGDAGIRASLDALEAAARANGARDRRPHLAHVQLVDPADIPRFGAAGVTANIQPLWAWADPFITELTEPRLGPDRSRWLYPFQSLRDAGARLAAGSDWSVSSMNPLEAIQVAVTRRGLDSSSRSGDEPWLPQERLDLATALAAYTREAAWLMRHEQQAGTLEVGKPADLVVLDRNLFELPPTDIAKAKVMLTLIDGVTVYEAR